MDATHCANFEEGKTDMIKIQELKSTSLYKISKILYIYRFLKRINANLSQMPSLTTLSIKAPLFSHISPFSHTALF